MERKYNELMLRRESSCIQGASTKGHHPDIRKNVNVSYKTMRALSGTNFSDFCSDESLESEVAMRMSRGRNGMALHDVPSPDTDLPDDFCFVDSNYRDTLKNHRDKPYIPKLASINEEDAESNGNSNGNTKQQRTASLRINQSIQTLALSHSAPSSKTTTTTTTKDYELGDVYLDGYLSPNHRELEKEEMLSKYVEPDPADSEGNRVWIAGSDGEGLMDSSKLYPLLCKQFIESTGCSRVPTHSDLDPFILKFTKSTNGNRPKLKYQEFLRFWLWFKECCEIVAELSFLWDCGNANHFLCNLFCGRHQSQRILDKLETGTFIIRLASVKGGVVISYFEEHASKRKMKHSLVTRKGPNQYEKKRKNAEPELVTIANIVRSSDKVRFLYTPKKCYPKKAVF